MPIRHDTFVMTRTYPKPPEKVFAAFSDPAKKRRWFAEGAGRDIIAYDMDFRVGGLAHESYCFHEGTPIAGMVLSQVTRYEDIVPCARIVMASTMSIGPEAAQAPMSVTIVTIELAATDGGTELICTHQGTFMEHADGPEMRKDGWRVLFDRLGEELAADSVP